MSLNRLPYKTLIIVQILYNNSNHIIPYKINLFFNEK